MLWGVPLFLSCIILVLSWLALFQVSEAQILLLSSGRLTNSKDHLFSSHVFFFLLSGIRQAGSRGAADYASGVDSETRTTRFRVGP